jgi:hypothetical protein
MPHWYQSCHRVCILGPNNNFYFLLHRDHRPTLGVIGIAVVLSSETIHGAFRDCAPLA